MLDLVRHVGIEGADVDLRGVHAQGDEGGDAGLVLRGVVEVILDVERAAGDVVEGLDGDGERVVVDGSTVRETSQKRPSVGASWRQRSGNLTSCSIFSLRLQLNNQCPLCFFLCVSLSDLSFQRRGIEEFDIADVLRLSTKYATTHLLQHAI